MAVPARSLCESIFVNDCVNMPAEEKSVAQNANGLAANA